MNKKRGYWWIFSGMLLIGMAILLVAYNILITNLAGRRAGLAARLLGDLIPSNSLTSGEYPDYILNPDMDMPVKEIDGVPYIGLLEIPALNLELPIQSEWGYPNMRISPCRYEGSIYLKNMVICGHNYATHFRPLFDVENGTNVYFTDMDGNQFEYQVIETEILAGDAVDEMVSGDWDLTLFTCTLGGVSRVTVRCALVNQQP